MYQDESEGEKDDGNAPDEGDDDDGDRIHPTEGGIPREKVNWEDLLNRVSYPSDTWALACSLFEAGTGSDVPTDEP